MRLDPRERSSGTIRQIAGGGIAAGPDTHIQIAFGPNVDVIGPAADRAQLKAIAMPGALTRAQAGELAAQLRFGTLPADFRITGISACSAASASSQAASG